MKKNIIVEFIYYNLYKFETYLLIVEPKVLYRSICRIYGCVTSYCILGFLSRHTYILG